MSSAKQARARAESLTNKICLFLRHDGLEKLANGDTRQAEFVRKEYERAIKTLEIMSELTTADRRRLTGDIQRDYKLAQQGLREVIVLGRVSGADTAASQVTGTAKIVRHRLYSPLCVQRIPPRIDDKILETSSTGSELTDFTVLLEQDQKTEMRPNSSEAVVEHAEKRQRPVGTLQGLINSLKRFFSRAASSGRFN